MQGKDEIIIDANHKWYDLKLKEVWQYKDLIILFVKRNYATRYKQTILGPAWLVISPMFTVLTYSVVFGGIAGLSTDGIPGPVFYLAGNILWTFFSANVSATANTFLGNAGIFGKIYFPRLITPISTVLTNLLDFGIQFILLLLIMLGFRINGEIFHINMAVLLMPLLLLELGLLGMGCGIIISSLTTKYRDLTVLVGFGLNIWMYASPIIYSTSLVPDSLMNIYMYNPVTPIILTFKYAFFGIGDVPYKYLFISWIDTLVITLWGVIVFNKSEKTFLDTV